MKMNFNARYLILLVSVSLAVIFFAFIIKEDESESHEVVQMKKENIENRIAFLVIDAIKYREEYLPMVSYVKEKKIGAIRDIVAEMNGDIKKSNNNKEHRKIYSYYNHALPYDFYCSNAKEQAQYIIDSCSRIISSGVGVKNFDVLHSLASYLLHKKCSFRFSDLWFLNEDVIFSGNFYDHYYKEFFPQFLYHYSSENEPDYKAFNIETGEITSDSVSWNKNYIPLNRSEYYRISTHAAKRMLEKLHKVGLDTSSTECLRYEYNTFEELLRGVLSQKYILLICSFE